MGDLASRAEMAHRPMSRATSLVFVACLAIAYGAEEQVAAARDGGVDESAVREHEIEEQVRLTHSSLNSYHVNSDGQGDRMDMGLEGHPVAKKAAKSAPTWSLKDEMKAIQGHSDDSSKDMGESVGAKDKAQAGWGRRRRSVRRRRHSSRRRAKRFAAKASRAVLHFQALERVRKRNTKIRIERSHKKEKVGKAAERSAKQRRKNMEKAMKRAKKRAARAKEQAVKRKKVAKEKKAKATERKHKKAERYRKKKEKAAKEKRKKHTERVKKKRAEKVRKHKERMKKHRKVLERRKKFLALKERKKKAYERRVKKARHIEKMHKAKVRERKRKYAHKRKIAK